MTSFQAAAVSVAKGAKFNGTVATFSAPSALAAGEFTATINWGDGTSSVATVVLGAKAGQFQIDATHTYAASGNYKTTITLNPVGSAALSANGSAAVK